MATGGSAGEIIGCKYCTTKKLKNHILQTLHLLYRPGDVVELRILNTGRSGTVSGYFNGSDKLAVAALTWSGEVPAIYTTLNPVDPALLSRAANRTVERAKSTTSDNDIVRRWWLPVDCDAVRPAGISSTNAEHEAALARAKQIREQLRERDWPEPIYADSGNGAHLLYLIDLPNNQAAKALVEGCLKTLDAFFSDDVVHVDTTTGNAARIWKLYGTMACKGDNTPERPHRMAKLLELPETMATLTVEQMQAMIDLLPKPKTPPTLPSQGKPFDLETWIADHNLSVAQTKEWDGGRMWILNPCPFDPVHTNGSAYILQQGNGAIGAGCHHNGCQGKGWHELRDIVEPRWREAKKQTAGVAFKQALAEIEAKLKDDPSLSPELYAAAITCLAKENPIAEDAGIKKLADLLRPLGVTSKAIREEIKRARKSNPGLRCDSVTGDAQNGTGQGDGAVTDGVTPDQPVYDIPALEEQAATVLSAVDPLHLAGIQIKSQGYGGDLKAPLIVYLAFTSRLLKMRTGSMPVHLLIHGPASAGKSYTIKVVILLLPPEAYHTIDAGSPRVLIYDPAPLKHRALIFGEADSLPAGEDNPAASAVRNLTQDGQLHYSVVTQNTSNTGYIVHEVVKPGPTVLITTAVRKLGHQLMTRLFTLDVNDDAKQVKAALATQARMETTGVAEVDPALIAFQSLLQAQAPWDVTVPFAEALAREISRATDAPRILRDFQRVLSLIKSVTVLRHRHRQRDEQGRLVAEIEDYKTVYELVADMYAATTTGASAAVREIVKIVQEIKSGEPGLQITYSVLAKRLGVHRQIAKRRADQALRLGWLQNNETRKGHTADLVMGEPMPPATGLPEPDTIENGLLQVCDGECDKDIAVENLVTAEIDERDEAVCHTVTQLTDDVLAGVI